VPVEVAEVSVFAIAPLAMKIPVINNETIITITGIIQFFISYHLLSSLIFSWIIIEIKVLNWFGETSFMKLVCVYRL